jgi:septum site-determining protein MinC
MLQKSIELTGSTFTLSVLYLRNNKVEIIKEALRKKIKESSLFFRNMPVVINVSELSNKVNWKDMKMAILSFGFHIVGIVHCHEGDLKNNILDSGLPILSMGKKMFIDNKKDFYLKKKNILSTQIIRTPIRSGQHIYAKDADLVVTNSVSAGAELVSDGNVHIYGVMRGRVLAGAKGDIKCNIFCTELFAELVSISGKYWLIDQIPLDFLGKSAQIFLRNNELNINRLY